MQNSFVDIAYNAVWYTVAFFDYLAMVYIWQLKEYRLDRFKEFISTKQGRSFFISHRFLWKPLLVLLTFILFSTRPFAFALVLFMVLLLDVLIDIRQVRRKQVRRPIFTKKSVLIIICILLLERLLIYLFPSVLTITLTIALRFLTASLVVFLFTFPTIFFKWLTVFRATKKMQKYPDLTVIGITGSYGKTTVKEFISDILSKKYKVVKTPRNTNTDIGVAQFILQTDFSRADVFVVEMGAYKEGEIKKICDIVRPGIGILTAINEQHLALFGSIKNIQKAKYELLRSIPEEGLVVTNADNEYCREFLHELRCKKIRTFGTDPDFKPDCLVENVVSTPEGIECDGSYKGIRAHLVAPVLGAHQASNLAAAIIVAIHLGMKNVQEIIDAVATIKNSSDTALRKYTYGNSIIIDDSYNSNPDGFSAALGILNSFPSRYKRVVITRGMIELGERSEELHERIGEEIAFCADLLIVINPDSSEYFKDGVNRLKDKFKLDIETIFDDNELLERVREFKKLETAILLENRIPPLTYAELSAEKQ